MSECKFSIGHVETYFHIDQVGQSSSTTTQHKISAQWGFIWENSHETCGDTHFPRVSGNHTPLNPFFFMIDIKHNLFLCSYYYDIYLFICYLLLKFPTLNLGETLFASDLSWKESESTIAYKERMRGIIYVDITCIERDSIVSRRHYEYLVFSDILKILPN
mgnify:CR=1 FL=1